MMLWHQGVFLKIRGSLDIDVVHSYWFQHVIMRRTNQIIPNKLRLCFRLPLAPFLILLCIFMVHVRFVLIVVHSMLCSGWARDVSYGAAALRIGDLVCYVLES